MGDFTKQQIKEIKLLHQQNWSIEYISWEYNTTVGRVKDILTGRYEANKSRELPPPKPISEL